MQFIKSKILYMNRIITIFTALLFSFSGTAQVSLSSTAGTTTGTFTTLKAAFDAINLGTHKGIITISITNNTTELASAVLYQTGYNSVSSYTSVAIYPTASGKSITGAISNAPLIDLSGASNVTIDGRVNRTGSTKDLTITNTATVTTSTIRFTNDAVSNTVQYCTVKGSSTSSTDGIFSFSSTGPVSGNDNNTITNNNITNAGTRSWNAIYSVGNATGINSGNTVSNNNFYDYIYTTGVSVNYGIALSSYNSDWTISGNSFYETTTLTVASGNTTSHTAIFISAQTGSGTNFIISNNYIGGNSASCSGTWTKNGAGGGSFTAISLATVTGGTASQITGNTIKGFSLTSTAAAPLFYGIHHLAGDATISTNIIGANTGTASVNLSNNNGGTFYGINLASAGAVTCQSNSIGAVTTNTTTFNFDIYCINRASTGAATISSNTIGSASTSASINASAVSSGSGAQVVYGINNSSTGTLTITGNTIANLTNGTTNSTTTTAGFIRGISTTSGTNTITNNSIYNLTIANANTATTLQASVIGLMLNYTTAAVQTITGNTVYGLSNSYASFAGDVTGIYYNGSSTASTVARNFIHSVSVTGASSTTASLYGIKIIAGSTTYSNNIISLGGNTTSVLYGIYESGTGVQTLYFNTVYISGSPSGSLNSYAFYSAGANSGKTIINNLLVNERSSSSGNHYALYFTATGFSGTLNCNANNYYVSGTGGILGYYGSNKTTLPVVSGVNGNDISSKNVHPLLTNSGGVTASDFLPGSTSLSGLSGTGITVDYTNTSRIYYSIGAYDFSVNGNVTLTATVGTLSGSYSTVKDAFDAINAGTHRGIIVITIVSSTTELASAVLNNSGNGSSNYSAITISPASGGLNISGKLPAPLIDLNGADNVIFDGRVNQSGSTIALTINNDSAVNTAGTSTVRFRVDATNNTFRYCTIKGSSLDATGGVLFFGGSNVLTGCDNNIIEYCNLTNADPNNINRPNNLIYSAGTASYENSGNTMRYNNIYDFHRTTTTSYGINLVDYNSAWTFTGNSFYETTNFAVTAANQIFYCININYTNYAGTGYSITGNYFGGKSATCGGGAWSKTGAFTSSFYAINVKAGTGNGNETNIDGNTIKNFNWSCAGAGAGSFYGISLSNGDYNIGKTTGNTIGASTGTGSITLDLMHFNGITNSTVSGILDCRNNSIGSITSSCTGNTSAVNIYGIVFNNASANVTVSGNTVGSITEAGSINASSQATGAAQYVIGIWGGYGSSTSTQVITSNTVANLINGTTNSTAATGGCIGGVIIRAGANTVTDNTVYNLTIANANTTAAYSNTVSAGGIYVSSSVNATHLISRNIVYNISNSNASFAGNVTGLIANSSNGSLTVSKNFIHSLSVTGGSGSTAAGIYGLYLYSGTITASNNVVYLGGNTSTGLYGITDGNSGTHNIYFNTVYLSGAPASGSTNTSAALYNISTAPVRNYRNNLLINTRSTDAGSNLHYALYITANTGTITCDFNDYIASGTGGVLGYFGVAKTTMPLVTNQDVYSVNLDPGFLSAGSTTASNYLASNTSLTGASSTGVADDYSSNNRLYHAMGAFDYQINPMITVTATSGTATAYYTEMRNAFDSINAGKHKGVIAVSVQNNITESASAVLYQSGYGGVSSYSSIAVRPSGGAARTISGNISGPILYLNGADNTSIDGLNSGSNSLTVQNMKNDSTASVISFDNEATNNTVTNCIIKGSVTPTFRGTVTDLIVSANTRGVVYFGPNASSSGNSGNTVSNCDIGPYSTNLPWTLIFSYGNASYLNQNTVSGNTMHDFHYNYSSTSLSNRISAVFLSSNNNAWAISNNHIYQSATRNYTNYGNRTSVILLTSGQGHTISGNTIGGSAADNSGTMTITGTPWSFYPIETTGLGIVNKTIITGNTIKNLSFTSTVDQPYSSFDRPRFTGILLEAGYYDITNNVIGSASADASVSPSVSIISSGTANSNYIGMIWHYTPSGTSIDNITGNQISGVRIESNNLGASNSPSFMAGGITVYGDKVGHIDNNIIGSATVANSIYITGNSPNPGGGSIAFGFRAIWTYFSAAVSPVLSISNNTIGNINLYVTGTMNANAGYLSGIEYTATSDATVSNNLVTNLSTNYGTFTTNGYNGEIYGINIVNTSSATTFTGNKVTALTSAINSVTGMSVSTGGASTKTVAQNFVSQLSAGYNTTGLYTSCSTTGTNYDISNNIIALNSTSGQSVYGIRTSGTANVYFNSIYLSGSGAANNYTSCLFSLSYDATKLLKVKNNIFFNNKIRTSGSYSNNAIWLYNSTTGATIDYNDYNTPNTGGSVGALGAAATQYATLAAFRTATGQDAASVNTDPQFFNAGGGLAENYIPATTGLTGVTGTGITTDYFQTVRNSGTPVTGAVEYVKLWTGALSENWNNASNWQPSLPGSTDNILFSISTANDLLLDQARTVNSINFNSSNHKLVLGNYNLVTGIVLNASVQSYIKTNGTGELRASVANGDTYSFASGNTAYNPVTVTNNSGNADQFSVRLTDDVYKNGIDGSAVEYPHITRTWHIGKSNPNGGSGVNFVFNWNTEENSGTLISPALYHYENGNWNKQTGTTSYSSSSLTYTGYTGTFSPFAIVDGASPLLVTGMKLNVQLNTDQALISWYTLTEQNTASFTTEHSTDGINWQPISVLPAAGFSNQQRNYTAIHRISDAGVHYYRIKLTDIDKSVHYSNIVVVHYAPGSKNLLVYPNPATSVIQVIIPVLQSDNALIEMYDLSGHLMRRYKGINSASTSIDISSLARGIYVLKVSNKNTTYQKLINKL